MAETDGNVAVLDAGASEPVNEEVLADDLGEQEQVAAGVDATTAEAATVEPGKPAPKWAGKTDAEIEAAMEAHANDREQRARQSERDKTTTAMLRANTEWLAKDGFETEVQGLTRAMLQGDVRYVGDDGALRPEVVKGFAQNVVARTRTAVQADTLNEFLGRLGTMLGGEKLTKEQQDEVQSLAVQAFQPDRTGIAPATNADVLAKATEQLIQLRIKAATEKIKADAIKEYKKTAEARSALERERETNSTNAQRPRPTNGVGSSVSSGFQPKTILEFDTAISEGRVPTPSRAEFNRITRGLPYS